MTRRLRPTLILEALAWAVLGCLVGWGWALFRSVAP